jgi:NAD(P)-dependent dehydrogenase (short-subunit alcohol dehydrogenase family)
MTEHRYTRYGSLQNKVVVITGGASGIGADLVAAFRQQESRVHFLDIDMTAGTALAQELFSSGRCAKYCRVARGNQQHCRPGRPH